MDAVIFIVLAIVFVFMDMKHEPVTIDDEVTESLTEDNKRVAKLNDAYYDDPNAFSIIINALGFPKGRE